MSFNILIVDDSDVIREMISRTLRLASVPIGELHHASDGRGALRVMEDEWIDLVLADINMPVMDGEEMLLRMREKSETADVPIIVVSTEGATERVDHLLNNGVSAWVRKPFTPEEIRDVITRVTGTLPLASEYHEHVDAVIRPVLETFAFVFPEIVEGGETPDPGGDVMCATLRFGGAVSGTMTICAPDSLCTELAANILGVEPDDPDVLMRGADALGEIANIATGHVVTRLEPAAQTNLQPPVVARMGARDWEQFASAPASRVYVVEGRPVVVGLALRPKKGH